MTVTKAKVGIVGCGNISKLYFKNAGLYKILDVVACADIDMARAKASAKQHNIPKACTPEELFADREIDMVINLTVPKAHAEVSLAALEGGKSVYSEKPLAITRDEARKLLELAEKKSLRIGCAPDTFLGGGLQTCRKAIDDGWIGEPVGAAAFLPGGGPERTRPDAEFLYQAGGGPMFDMGPYYLTALVSMLGPVRRVTASTRISFPERIVTAKENFGKRIKVEVPTFIAGVIDFAAGPVGTILATFDVTASQLPRIEVYGSEGTLSCPDPNTFDGPVIICKNRSNGWSDIPLPHESSKRRRGLGAADMAQAIASGRPHRANGEMAYHVLDIMCAFHDASEQGRHVELESTCQRPAPLSTDLLRCLVDE